MRQQYVIIISLYNYICKKKEEEIWDKENNKLFL